MNLTVFTLVQSSRPDRCLSDRRRRRSSCGEHLFGTAPEDQDTRCKIKKNSSGTEMISIKKKTSLMTVTKSPIFRLIITQLGCGTRPLVMSQSTKIPPAG